MKLPRRNFLHLAAGAAALPAVSQFARAQAYPTRPVRIVVGFPAGGSASDIVARLIGQWLSERLGQQFVVENRPGAATNSRLGHDARSLEERRAARAQGQLLGLFSPAAYYAGNLSDNLSIVLVKKLGQVTIKSVMASRDAAN